MKNVALSKDFLRLLRYVHRQTDARWKEDLGIDPSTIAIWEKKLTCSLRKLATVCSRLDFLGSELLLPEGTLIALKKYFGVPHRPAPANQGTYAAAILSYRGDTGPAGSPAPEPSDLHDTPSAAASEQSPAGGATGNEAVGLEAAAALSTRSARSEPSPSEADPEPAGRDATSGQRSSVAEPRQHGADVTPSVSPLPIQAPRENPAQAPERTPEPGLASENAPSAQGPKPLGKAVSGDVAPAATVHHSPASLRRFVGSPSAARLAVAIAASLLLGMFSGYILSRSSARNEPGLAAPPRTPVSAPPSRYSQAEIRELLESLSGPRTGWLIAYEPSQQAFPGAIARDDQEGIQRDLNVLREFGCFSGVITFGSDGPLFDVPPSAEERDLAVLMGIYINPSEKDGSAWTEAQIRLATRRSGCVDAYILGHVERHQVDLDWLRSEISHIRGETDRPTTVSFPIRTYTEGPDAAAIRELGDFLCPDVGLEWRTADVSAHVAGLKARIDELAGKTRRPILLKVVAAPSAPQGSGQFAFTEETQSRFYKELFEEIIPNVPDHVFFSFGFAFDSRWKESEPAGLWSPAAAHLGLFHWHDRSPKPAAEFLRSQAIRPAVAEAAAR